MSRLIDADKLVKAIKNENPSISISDTIEKFARTIQVQMQPTVNAIPVEWIKKVIEKYATFEYHVEIDDIEARRTLRALIEDWGKENEIN